MKLKLNPIFVNNKKPKWTQINPLKIWRHEIGCSSYIVWTTCTFFFVQDLQLWWIWSFTLLCSTCKSLTFFLLFSSYTFKNLNKCVALDCPLKHKQNAHSYHVKFFRLYTSFNMVKDQPKPLSNWWRQDHNEVVLSKYKSCWIGLYWKLSCMFHSQSFYSCWSTPSWHPMFKELGHNITHQRNQVWKPSLWLTYI